MVVQVLAMRWAGHLKSSKLQVVMVANTGYTPGKTHFSCRVARCARPPHPPTSPTPPTPQTSHPHPSDPDAPHADRDAPRGAPDVDVDIIALLNDRLIAAGKSPLGFLNPFLYSTGASAFNDITSGTNPGCNTDGFPATTGWDPITGLGTPDFVKLLTAVGL